MFCHHRDGARWSGVARRLCRRRIDGGFSDRVVLSSRGGGGGLRLPCCVAIVEGCHFLFRDCFLMVLLHYLKRRFGLLSWTLRRGPPSHPHMLEAVHRSAPPLRC